MSDNPEQVDTRTAQRRWNDAVGALHRDGVFVKQNIDVCCGSCAFYEMKHRNCESGNHAACEGEDRFAYTRAPQGFRQFWQGGALLQQESWRGAPAPAKKIYWEHDSDDQATLILIHESFRANGFEVEDGSLDRYPAIILDEVEQHIKYRKLIGFAPMDEKRVAEWRQQIAYEKTQFKFDDSAPNIPDVEPFVFLDDAPYQPGSYSGPRGFLTRYQTY